MDGILVGGGGVINWFFIQAGLCEEVSIVVSPSADGSHDMPSLFEDSKYADNTPVTFKLDHVEKLEVVLPPKNFEACYLATAIVRGSGYEEVMNKISRMENKLDYRIV